MNIHQIVSIAKEKGVNISFSVRPKKNEVRATVMKPRGRAVEVEQKIHGLINDEGKSFARELNEAIVKML